MRTLATIQKIKSLSPIPKADAIEKAEVLGWELVVKKGEFKVGDLCVYIEIDSIVPEYPVFEFLRPRGFKIRTVKLRSQISQGIALPLDTITQIDPKFNLTSIKEGMDLTEVLKIKKRTTEEEKEQIGDIENKSWFKRKLSYLKWKLLGKKKVRNGTFPKDISKTDETRIQVMGRTLQEQEGNLFYITEKLEGCSGTFVFRKEGNWLAKWFNKDYNFQICSRNFIVSSSNKPANEGHHIVQVAKKFDIENKMKKLNRNLAIQAEILGPKIQGNLYKFPEYEMRIFLMYDLDNFRYLTWEEMSAIAKETQLPLVPLLAKESLINSVKHYVEMSKGKSVLNSKKDREGIVIRSIVDGRISFKVINPEYLLKQQEDVI